MRCPLCGCEFDAAERSCHSSCAFNEACAIICCPNCGYQMPDEGKSRLASVLRRLMARRRGESEPLEAIRPLSQMQSGQSARVIRIESGNEARMERLHLLGITPDARVTLEQKQPTYVLRVGFTEFSVEREIADEILVEVLP